MSGEPGKANKPPARLRLRVTAAAESILRGGHPWLFAESIQEQNREGTLGELAVVYDRKDRFLAMGLYDPDSPIRLRVLHAGKPQAADSAWWSARMKAAFERRTGLFDEQTTGYRLVNGESDGWPGLVLDRYGSTLVLKLYTAAWLPQLETLVRLVAAEAPWAPRLVLRLSRNIQEAAQLRFSRSDGQVLCGGPLEGPVIFSESGLKFEAEVLRGQKTGFFLDQRENRRKLETFAAERHVLNAFSFSGGFSLYAARGGARSVTDLDLSVHALESSRRNFALNHADARVAVCAHERIQGEAFEWLGGNSGRTFGLVVLDPPSLARREAERAGALRAYAKLAEAGTRHLERGGLLLACSCSAHVSSTEFFQTVRSAVARSKRKVVELATAHHAPDHPATFKEAEYLKAIYLRVE